MIPEQAQSKLDALLTARQTAWRSIAARCDTSEPFTREEGVEILEACAQSLDVDLGFIRHLVPISRPVIPIPELMARAERVASRVQELAQRLCGVGPQSTTYETFSADPIIVHDARCERLQAKAGTAVDSWKGSVPNGQT